MSSPWKDFPNSATPPPRRIVCDAHTCFGKPRIEGTRLHLLLFVGMTREQVVEAWPDLNLTDEEWTAIQSWLASAEGRRAHGFTVPATDSWPPLSREQVVELHEALVRFVTEMSSARKPMSSDDQQTTIWGAAVELHGLLERLNIGTPPQPRRWTTDDIQAAMEKHERELLGRLGVPKHFLGPGPSSATALALRSPMEARRTQGAWEEPTAIRSAKPPTDPTGFQAPPVHYVQQERETIDRIRDSMTDGQFIAFCWGNVMKYRDRADSKGDPEADTRKALWYERMMLHVAVGSADPRSDRPNFQPYQRQPSDMPLVWVETAPSPTASLVSSPLGVKHNCWTCGHNMKGVGAWGCNAQEMGTVRWLSQMANRLLPQDDGSRMPSKTSDGCPGWEPKP